MAFKAELLRKKLKAEGKSRDELAAAINKHKRTVSRWLAGTNPPKVIPPDLKVYQPRSVNTETREQAEQVNFTTKNTAQNTEIERLKADLALAEARAEAAEKLAQERADRIEDLRRILPSLATSEGASRPRGWWPWRRR